MSAADTLTAAVFASAGGLRYHARLDCPALVSAQGLNDWDCPGDYCLHNHARTHAAVETTVTEALGAGKTPCLVCLPASGAGLARSACEDDFGHEPFRYDGVEICARCYVTEVSEWVDAFDAPRRRTARAAVPWPCTSAVVLGLAPREGASR